MTSQTAIIFMLSTTLPERAAVAAACAMSDHVVVFAGEGTDTRDRLGDAADGGAPPLIASVGDNKAYYAALNRVVHGLAQDGRAILFVPAGFRFDASSLSALEDALCADPLYGFALPRTNRGGSASVPRRAGEEPAPASEAFTAFLDALPSHAGGGIVRAAPVLVHGDMFRDFGRLEGEQPDLSDALARLYIRANRRGYSAVVANRAWFECEETEAVPAQPAAPSLERASDYAKALARQAHFPEQVFEKLLWERLRPKTSRSVLFDIRNLAPGYNGTAQHILSLLGPVRALAAEFGITPFFWVSTQSAQFHGLDRTMPESIVHEVAADACFDASIRLSQPWSFSELRDQARRSATNLYLIMDAIAWDCHYIRMPHVDGVWRAAAAFADGFVFNSGYTQRAFHERFPVSRGVPGAISHCSLDPADYHAPEAEGAARDDAAPYLLVVGNQYYHKGLHESVRALAAGFPETRFKVLGEISERYANVEQLPSGMLSNEDVNRLYRECVALVFPSFYEGFGLPVLTALSFGKPVIARHSLLIDEIRDHVAPVDGIMPFDCHPAMLRAVQTVLKEAEQWRARRSQPVRPRSPRDWSHAARVVMQALDDAMRRGDLLRCRERLEFFYRVEQFDVERVGWTNADQNRVVFEVELEE